MCDVTEDAEQLYLDYIEENKAFLKDFHRVYYTKYKEYLEGYALSNYMITSYVKANKVAGYNDYDGFINGYLLQLSEDIEEAIEIYNSYYYCFIENMSRDIKYLKRRYDKDDDDIYTAYEIKTVFQFYTGFLIEKKLMYHINGCGDYMVADRTLEERRYVDNTFAVDIEVVGVTGQIMAIQCKSYTYLNISEDKKLIHINKHIEYMNAYDNSNTYYVLYKDYKPCYYIKDNKPCYLVKSVDVLGLNQSDIQMGTYEGLIKQIKGWKNERGIIEGIG